MKRIKMTRKRKVEVARKDRDWKRKVEARVLAREMERVEIAGQGVRR